MFNEKAYMKKYYIKHKKQIKEYRRNYYEQHKKKIAKQMKEYGQKHKEEIAKKTQEYYLKNKEKINKQNKKYYLEHKEELRVCMKEYAQKHKKELNEYQVKKRNNDIQRKIACNLRSRIWEALKGETKSASTAELIGCSIKKLKQHLEKQFTKGMLWKNYGKWHRDEIIPCAKFDLRKPSEQRKCFNWRNMQPLWAKENMSKGCRI